MRSRLAIARSDAMIRPLPRLRERGILFSRSVLRLVPLVEAGLDRLRRLLGLQGPVDHRCRYAPELVLQVRLSTGEDLVRVTDRRFARLAQIDRLLGDRVVDLDALAFEVRDVPRARGIDRALAALEVRLGVRIGDRLKAVGQVWLPARE